MTIHHFKDKLAEGQTIEARLDRYFEKNYEVLHATPAGQRAGIDRYFCDRDTGARASVDYKADFRAVQTGNAFIEMVSVDTNGKPGWAVASQAMWVLYFLPQTGKLYVLRMETLREKIPLWSTWYRVADAQNDSYKTSGLLVPLTELDDIASKILIIHEEK